jgi:hypothetical protein
LGCLLAPVHTGIFVKVWLALIDRRGAYGEVIPGRIIIVECWLAFWRIVKHLTRLAPKAIDSASVVAICINGFVQITLKKRPRRLGVGVAPRKRGRLTTCSNGASHLG